MTKPGTESVLPRILKVHKAEILSQWLESLKGNYSQNHLIKESELQHQCKEFLDLIEEAFAINISEKISDSSWSAVKDFLSEISRSRALQGFTPTQTVNFIFSLKQAVFEKLKEEFPKDVDGLTTNLWYATNLIDQLGLFTAETFQKSREEIIQRQQEDMLELSTPVVKLWDGVLALPMIGTLDSARTQVVMETLLQRIVETEAEIAIIDITGVPTVDTLVAQHLLKTVTAARLMGADCIISGIRPQIAQTIVHLGVDLADIKTKASLADAFILALRQTGYVISKNTPTVKF